MTRILNLGCGNKPLAAGPGEVVCNHDLQRHRPEVDVIHDLNCLPWPWADESFDCIVARAVLEHLNIDLVQAMDECWRILGAKGTACLKLPFWQAEASYTDPTHRWRFNLHSMEIFDPETASGREYAFYTTRKWRLVKGPRLNDTKTSIHVLLEVRKP